MKFKFLTFLKKLQLKMKETRYIREYTIIQINSVSSPKAALSSMPLKSYVEM